MTVVIMHELSGIFSCFIIYYTGIGYVPNAYSKLSFIDVSVSFLSCLIGELVMLIIMLQHVPMVCLWYCSIVIVIQ